MIIDVSIESFLQQTKIPLRLSTVTASGWPVVLSLWYWYDKGILYCATPQKALTVAYLENEPRCGFEVAGDQPPYCGVRGRALATINEERGIEILRRLLIRYLGDADNPLAQGLLNRSELEVAICLEPQSIFAWNFNERMGSSLKRPAAKICPEVK